MTVAVTTERLRRSFGSVRAVDDMTWSAELGRVTAVLGPNGAGKTTTMEILEGLQRPDEGIARVLGTDPWNASAEHRARVGVMLQDGGLPNGARPVGLLRHLSSLYADPVHLDDLVSRLGIDCFAGTTVRRLSGGQRQRVALAAALVGNPEVVFLDEPTAGLDPHARLDVWDLVRETRDRGVGVVVTTHSFEEAERLADHLVVISDGRVVGDGSPDDLCAGRSLEDVYFELTRKAR
ncbi:MULTISPECIES: ABC transporter ATP-binding protein [Arsenicicoccus]|uniref:ABC transporter ATP-binding protein n=1 Tax=Arsenicicoccus bolidensis TaxID=229480 RepID=A0ABS9Q428_9MICO|nr:MULTISPECIES: ABC transporter ATP-binding protein [Arsenicicoccus]MCG7322620.1 ABC transporter ATP-binding protein [Arsenicicoccus bolidensis]